MMHGRNKRVARKITIIGVLLGVLIGSLAVITGPASIASADVITKQQAEIICADYQKGPQAQSGITLAGHKISINAECNSGETPPVSTLAVICRAGMAGFDGSEGARSEQVDPNSPKEGRWRK